jgi:hypothetical protein
MGKLFEWPHLIAAQTVADDGISKQYQVVGAVVGKLVDEARKDLLLFLFNPEIEVVG